MRLCLARAVGKVLAAGGCRDASMGPVGRGPAWGFWLGRRLLVPAAGGGVGVRDAADPAAACSAMAGLPVPNLQPSYRAGLAPGPGSCGGQHRLGAEAHLGRGTRGPLARC